MGNENKKINNILRSLKGILFANYRTRQV